MVVAGHYLAAHAGFNILESGGNAIDAGCAAGIALGVLQSDLVNIAGVAPIILYHAKTEKVITISGLGTWPKSIPQNFFDINYDGHIPENILRTVVPAAPDAWITALEQFGTMTFSDIAEAAIRFATEGFVMYPLMSDLIQSNAEDFKRWDSNKEIYLPNGRVPQPGELFIQKDLGKTLQYMADEEKATTGNRIQGLRAARDAFYKGDIARQIVKYHEENEGFLSFDDLSEFKVGIEDPVEINFLGTTVYSCGPWCQGPTLLQCLRLLDRIDLTTMGQDSSAYIHSLTEAIKLSFADRHFYYGDPNFVDVPIEILISEKYNDMRRQLISSEKAWPGMPPAGDPFRLQPTGPTIDDAEVSQTEPMPSLDTSYVCVTDSAGNIFSSTPSDIAKNSPVIPNTGLCPSSRGGQSWSDPDLPSAVQANKRPRLTPNPALAIRKGEYAIPFGTPGGDIQVQAMLQCFLNVTLWDMNPQEAVEMPRFGTYSFPDSFEPHDYHPGRLMLEPRFSSGQLDELRNLGHCATYWPDWTWRAGAVCMIKSDLRSGIHTAGADPRRPTYAVGW
jgi:gamma-glutamyltranspeptidase/glutathione hydrolase